MLKTEYLNNGAIIHNYSDCNKYILQKETGLKYTEAYDTVPCIYNYEETEENIVTTIDKDKLEEERLAREEELKKLNIIKQQQISISKYSLQKWLEQHPYLFTKESGDSDYYTVTEDKQQLLALEIMTDQIKIKSGIECTPTWNAQGKICESWDFDELNRLAIEISNYVKPRVSKQQHIEAEIQAAETEYDVMNISVIVGVYD